MGSVSVIHWLILLLPAGVVALVLLSRRRGRRGDLTAPPRPAQPATIVPPPVPSEAAAAPRPVTLPPDVEMKVWVELRDGNVINAVKLVHDATGLHLKEAKDAVDELRRRDPRLR